MPDVPERIPAGGTEVKDIKEIIKKRSSSYSKRVEFLPIGCGNLSLAASGRIECGFPRQRVINLVGDGSSGKTLLALEFLAAVYFRFKAGLMTKTDLFEETKRLRLIYNNVEGVMDFPIEEMYKSVRDVERKDGLSEFYEAIEWIKSTTVEQFGEDFFPRIKKYHHKNNPQGYKKGDTVIYVIDSWDALDSKEDKEKFDSNIAKVAAGKKLSKDDKTGSYELGKQRYASKRFFKKLCGDIEDGDFDITLVIVSQVRQKIGVTFGEKTYRAGGDAMNFYTHLVIWLREKAKLKMTRLGQTRVYGIDVAARVRRSKVWKPFRECDFKIIFDYGIDDIQSLMDFYFGPKKNPINWLEKNYDREDLIELFHNDPEQFKMLQFAVQEIWDEVERRVTPTRRKYT